MKKHKLILLAVLMCAPVFTHAATVISSVPYTISAPGEYALGKNLTAQGTNGILVNASNVSIDLAGYTLSGGNAFYGIQVSTGMSNVSVQNGTITGFGFGVVFEPGSGDSVTNVQILNIGRFGLLEKANNCLVENCSFVGGAPSSNPTGIYIYQCGAVEVRNNLISECYYGVLMAGVTTPSALIENYEATCTYGLFLDSKSKYQGNVTTNCTTPISGGIAVGQENG